MRRELGRWGRGLAGVVLLVSVAGCGAGQHDLAADGEGQTMTVKSAAFEPGAEIPAAYTCEGENVSPPLTWEGAPSGTVTLALICDDPDAPMGTFSHWVICDMPPETAALPEAVPAGEQLAEGGRQGRNGFGDNGYGGPCPPSGEHRYRWTVYALDTTLLLDADATRGDLLEAMEGHVLATGQLVGRYQKAN